MRIVSLLPSSTEIVYALDCGDQLVGRSHECDFPVSVQELPICTEPKFVLDGTSYEIDQRLKAIVQEGLGVYRVRTDVLDRLAPDVIITQSQCEVCAVSLQEVEAAVCQMIRSQPAIVALEPNTLDDVWTDMRRVADALGVPAQGVSLVADCKARMAAIAEQAAGFSHKPTVVCIEWMEPLMAAGNWMPRLVEMAGGVSLLAEADKHSPWITWEHLKQADPDVIVLVPCGWGIEQAQQAMTQLTVRLEWQSLRAVQAGRVFLADGHNYFNRPGPRLVESLEILAEMLHPDQCHYGHEGNGWQCAASALA